MLGKHKQAKYNKSQNKPCAPFGNSEEGSVEKTGQLRHWPHESAQAAAVTESISSSTWRDVRHARSILANNKILLDGEKGGGGGGKKDEGPEGGEEVGWGRGGRNKAAGGTGRDPADFLSRGVGVVGRRTGNITAFISVATERLYVLGRLALQERGLV